MRFLLIIGVLLALICSASATTITYNFATGSGINSPVWPASSGSSGNTNAISLGTNTLLLDDPNTGGLTSALQLTGSSTVYCVQAGSTPGTCAATATSNVPEVAGHAAGIGVGNGRLEGSETFTIIVLAGYTAQLLSIQTTALYDETSEQWQYAINGGAPTVLNATNQAIDAYNFNSAFNTLTLSVPAGGPPNSFALYSLQVDVNPIASIPEPSSILLMGGGLVGLGLFTRRRYSRR